MKVSTRMGGAAAALLSICALGACGSSSARTASAPAADTIVAGTKAASLPLPGVCYGNSVYDWAPDAGFKTPAEAVTAVRDNYQKQVKELTGKTSKEALGMMDQATGQANALTSVLKSVTATAPDVSGAKLDLTALNGSSQLLGSAKVVKTDLGLWVVDSTDYPGPC